MVASSNSFYYQSKGWNITARVGTSGGGVWEIVRTFVRGMCPKI